MTITAIILAHYKQRQNNLKRIVDDLLDGSVTPNKIVVFIDNPEVEFEDNRRVTTIRSDGAFLPRIRFSLGTYFDTDYCLFIDDDLTVKKHTLENLLVQAEKINDSRAILGVRGSILGNTDNPYADDTSIKTEDRGGEIIEVDIVLRLYFVPRNSVGVGLYLQGLYPDLPDVSLDDVYLCMGNKYLNSGRNYVISVDERTGIADLDEAGVGQSVTGLHYENRNKVCKYLLEQFVL